MFNQWKISGEVFYLKELQGEFAASVRIRGVSKRPNEQASKILEVLCLMTPTVYDEAMRLGLRKYHDATLSGHVESWVKNDGDMKTYFIVDKVESIGGYK